MSLVCHPSLNQSVARSGWLTGITSAVLSAGLPGQETGNAIVDILFGAVNPSGRLPYTMAKERTDYPADVVYELGAEDTPPITYSEGLEIDYR